MKKNLIFAGMVMLISGCQQQIKEFNDAMTNLGSYPASSNSGQKFEWESLPMVTEDEVCSAFRQHKESARAKYIGRDLIQNGVVQCVIDKPYAWNVGNVISLRT